MTSDSTYEFTVEDAHPLFPRWYAVIAYDFGDPKTGAGPLETAPTANAVYLAPSGIPGEKVMVVPNPYRAYEDYTMAYAGGLSWENQDDGNPQFFPNTDRRIEFINPPAAMPDTDNPGRSHFGKQFRLLVSAQLSPVAPVEQEQDTH